MPSRIFVKCSIPDSLGDVQVVALSEDDEVIAAHISSSMIWARTDIIRPHHLKEMASYYTNGYELVWQF